MNLHPLPHDPYMDAVDQWLHGAGLACNTYSTSATDDDSPDRRGLTGVFSWTGENPAIDPQRMPEGFALFWSPTAGWRWAPRTEDGGTEPVRPLGVDTWASPRTVSVALNIALSRDRWTGHLADAVRAAVQQWQPDTSPASPPATMTVTVRDRASEAPWGVGPVTPVTRTITISAHCPACGGRRGEPQGLPSVDDGAHYWVQVWHNPCGHTDSYEAVLAEADALAAQAPQGR